MIRCLHWLTACLLAVCAPARAGELLESVAARVHASPVLHGEFVQERSLAGFSKPLRSSGRFLAARGQGVIWSTTEPFPGELVISADTIRERVEGSETVLVAASREPALREVNRILMALLQGELAALSGQFEVAGANTQPRWSLHLTPHGGLAEAIASIDLEGDVQVRRVAIHEPGGDSSLIVFSAHLGAQALTPAEAARFD